MARSLSLNLSRLRERASRPAQFDANERTLVSPLELRSPAKRAAYWLVFGALVALTITTLFPIYWMYSGALKDTSELIRMPPTLLPAQARWENYLKAWDNLNYTRYFANTLILAFGALVIQLVVSTSAAFSLSKLKPAGGRLVLFLFLSTLMVPSMAYLIPAYLTVVSLPIVNIPLIDTWWGVWLPGAASAFNIFVLKSFFDEIPQDLIDAANIDGAGAARILAQIMIPLSRPVLAVVSIFTLIGAWKDFFWPFLVLSKVELQPIMVALWRLSARMQEPLNLIIAGLAIASTPPIILFLIFQKQIIRGITLTGLKG